MKYKFSEYAKLHNVTYRTVWDWMYKGLITVERSETGRNFVVENENQSVNDYVAVYARVSSAENKKNLEAQQKRLEDYCAARGYKVIKSVAEVGSGLNDERKKLEQLLLDTSVKKIVVEHSDRFSRFGMNYIVKLLAMQGRYVEVINEQKNDRDDLMQDFVSIITSFCARLYGLRRNKRRTEKIIEELSKE